MSPHRLGPSSRHPFEIFVLALCVIVGIPLLFGEPTQGSVNALLPRWAVYAWGTSLSVASLVALVGIFLARRPRRVFANLPFFAAGKNVFLGVVLEQAGLGIVALATVFYSITIFAVSGLRGLTAGAIVLGFGLSCAWRYGQIQKVINTAGRRSLR